MVQRVIILDYGSGNLRSVEKAFERAASEIAAPFDIIVTGDPVKIRQADRLVLPGVGAFAACMAGLSKAKGVLEALEHCALVDAKPFLGICVGMQLLAETGYEFGEHQGLGWIPGKVTPLPVVTPKIRSPHMGWNDVEFGTSHPLFSGIEKQAFYFAHSYRFEPENAVDELGLTVHGEALCAGVGRDNIVGVQFHPEKSQQAGITLLKNFLSWSPS